MLVVLTTTFLLQSSCPLFAFNGNKVANLTEQGIQKFKGSFSGSFTPRWFITKFGIKTAYHLIDCLEKHKKPSIRAVVKSMATADYLAGTAGGMLGGAAGSFLVPFLSTVPIVGGLLADFVPTMAYYLGAQISHNTVAAAKSGKFSIKKVFKKIDWLSVVTGGFGWAAGSMLCTAILPPIGGIAGGILGDFIMGKLASKIRKFFGKTDTSPPPVVAHNGGPANLNPGNIPESSVYSSSYLAPNYLPTEGVSLKSTGKLVVLRQKYQALYKKYISSLNIHDSMGAVFIANKMRTLKFQMIQISKQ